jgi:hypothetical protein
MQLRIPVDTHDWLKRYALDNKTTMTEIITTYLSRLKARKEGTLPVLGL